MAVIDALPGVEVTINIGGTPLKEHCDTDIEEDGEKVTRFIEVAPNQNFTVDISIQEGTEVKGNSLMFEIRTDGEWTDSTMICKDYFSDAHFTYICAGPHVGENLVQKYRFSNLEIADNDYTSAEDMKRGGMIGSIEVLASYVNLIGIATPRYSHHRARDSKTIPQKAIKGKGIDHLVLFSAPQETDKKYNPVSVMTVPGYKNPVAVFEFRYRSKECLQSMLLIPRSLGPLPLEERAIESLSKADIQELQRHYQATKDQKSVNIKLKRERADDDNPRPRRSARPYAGCTQLEIDEEGNFREIPVTGGAAREVIELD